MVLQAAQVPRSQVSLGTRDSVSQTRDLAVTWQPLFPSCSSAEGDKERCTQLLVVLQRGTHCLHACQSQPGHTAETRALCFPGHMDKNASCSTTSGASKIPEGVDNHLISRLQIQ